MSKREHPYYDDRTLGIVTRIGVAGVVIAVLSVILSCATLVLHVAGAPPSPVANVLKGLLLLLALGWALGPPIWFAIEYWRFFYPLHGREDATAFDHFRQNQQYATAQWAGVLFVVGLTLSTVL